MMRALVTGAAAGLARTVAVDLASSGWFDRVVITYRETSPDATIAAIEANGVPAVAHRVEFLGDESDVVHALESTMADGPYDVLVHGVGPMVVGRFEHASMQDYTEMFDGNVRSFVLAARAALPAMRERRFGRIVVFGMNGSSVTRPAKALPLHLAAKSALVALARTLAVEEASHGITINVVEPGDIRKKTISRAQALALTAGNPRGRPGTAEDVAAAVRFFVDPTHDFITGAVLGVTGGLTGFQEPKQ